MTRQRHDLLLHLVESRWRSCRPGSQRTDVPPPADTSALLLPAHCPVLMLCSGVTDSNAEPAVRNENILGKSACRGTDLLNGS